MMQPDQSKPPTSGVDEVKLPAKPEYSQVRLRFARKSNQLYASLATFNELANLPSDVMRIGELVTHASQGRIDAAYREKLSQAGWNCVTQKKGDVEYLLIRSKDLQSVMGISVAAADAQQNRSNSEFTVIYRVPKEIEKPLQALVAAVQVWLSINPR